MYKHSTYLFLLFSLIFQNVLLDVCAQSNPQALAPGIGITRILTIRDGAIRVSYNPVDGQLYYTDTQGNIYVVIRPSSGPAYDSLVYTTADNGVEYIQGMDIHDSIMYVSGNNGSSTPLTIGIIARGVLQPNGTRTWSTLMETDQYKTADYFDHLFSGMTVDPSGDSLVICSGARGDHGEIQTRYGIYPGVRNEPLTARVFKLPTHDANTIILQNDSAWLENSGYVYANGIRNTFDMAFDHDGNLFGVENSGDRDHNEEMNWLRRNHHYGFPWRMGDTRNPQQDASFDPATDPLIPHFSRSWRNGFWNNDPDFPQLDPLTVPDEPIQNFGPDCDKFRDTINGNVLDASDLGISMGTFTAHRSPLGLVFDKSFILHPDYSMDGFMLSWTEGLDSCGCTTVPDTSIGPFVDPSQDLVHLDLSFNSSLQNYTLNATRIVSDFAHPVDDDIHMNSIYVLENGYGGTSGLYEITLPFPPDCLPNADIFVQDLCTPSVNSISIDTFGIIPNHIFIHTQAGANIIDTVFSSGLIVVQNLQPDNYMISFEDAFNCTDTLYFTISDSVHFTTINTYPTSCIGCLDGATSFTAEGGVTPYQYTLYPPVISTGTDTIGGLPAGQYQLCVTDANGCTSCDSLIINEDPSFVTFNTNVTEIILSPSPARDEISISWNSFSKNDTRLRVMNSHGKVAIEKNILAGTIKGENVRVAIQDLTAGVYTLELLQNEIKSSKKFVVVR